MPVEIQLGKSHTKTSAPFQSLAAMAVCIQHLRGRCDGEVRQGWDRWHLSLQGRAHQEHKGRCSLSKNRE